MTEQLIGVLPGEVLGTLADIMLKLKNGGITPDELKRFAKRENPFDGMPSATKVQVGSVARSVDEFVAEWGNFYREIGIEVDLTGLRVPERREGFDRLIVVAKGMSPERAYQKCLEHFRCWKYVGDRNLDESVFDIDCLERKYRRSDNETYAVWVRDREEADQELKNRSANDLAVAKISGITLEARELYELKYFKETGKHLDRYNWTLCAGSRSVDGRVLRSGWNDGRFFLGWYDPVGAHGVLRSREAVS
ncbi:MAG: hypothetical protein AAB469_01410 [Patescibacteria group bacterium]